MTWFDRISFESLLLDNKEVEEVLDRMQTPIDRRRLQSFLVLLLHKTINVTSRDLRRWFVNLGKEQVQINRVTLNGMRRVIPHPQVLSKLVNFCWSHCSPPRHGLAFLDPLHRPIVLLALRRVIQLRIAQRHLD